MIELAQHIEKLLLENDCVVIPGFGGFVVHYNSAIWDEEQQLFQPPTRVLGFNTRLKMNDGLLVQSYMESYHTSFPDAALLVSNTVHKLIQYIQENGEIRLINIGIIHSDASSNYQFTPYNEKLISPTYFGFNRFHINPLDELSVEPVKPILKVEVNKKVKTKKSYPIIRYAAAVAIAIIVFFNLSVPVDNVYTDHLNQANLLPSELFRSPERNSVLTHEVDILPSERKQPEITENKIEYNSTDNATSDPDILDKTEPKIYPAEKALKQYHIIVGSLTDMDSATKLVNKIKEQGNPGACILTGNGKIRVSAVSFSSQNDARHVLHQIRKYDAYRTAWILKK